MSDDLTRRVNGLVRMTLLVMAIWLLGWGLTPWKPLFLGLILGTLVSFVNALQMAWRVRRFFRRIQRTGSSPRFVGGMAFRFSMAILAAMVALRFPHQVDLLGTILGLVTAPVMNLIHGLVTLKEYSIHKNEP